MKLATIRTPTGHAAARIDAAYAVEIGPPDLGALLREPRWRQIAAAADGPRHELSTVDYSPVVPNPAKIFCVGLTYRSHIRELGRELPRYPTLFAKFANCLLGAYDDIVLPAVSEQVDWEAELGVLIGPDGTIAGYTIVNDISMRDWQWRTTEWLQGKAFQASTPVGPWLVTPDEAGTDLEISCAVDGTRMQHARTSDLLFTPDDLVAYISQFTTLEPGDLIATGTPGGVGAARDPKVFLRPEQEVWVTIEGLGECRSRCVAKKNGEKP